MPLFSVVIPTYNRASLLAETLASVFQQRLTDFEVLVVDDGSTDETSTVLATYSERLRVLQQQNRGPGAARNFGYRHADGQYVAFLDSDDIWFPWTLEAYAQVIRQMNEPAFIAGKPKRFSERRELDFLLHESLALKSFSDYYASGDEWRWWGVSSFVIRTDALRAVGGFTDKWINLEDADLAMRLGEARGFVQVCSPFTFGYREHADSATKCLPRTVEGVWHKVRSEKNGQYPGGRIRAVERWRILSRHIRPVTVECLRKRLSTEAWGLYRATFQWNLRLHRWRYLAAIPFLATVTWLRRTGGAVLGLRTEDHR